MDQLNATFGSEPKVNRVQLEKHLMDELRKLIQSAQPQRTNISKENILFELVQMFTGRNLSVLFDNSKFKKSAPLSMKPEERSVILRERRQLVVLKQQAAFDALKKFIEQQNPGTSWKTNPLTRVVIMQTMIKYLKNEIPIKPMHITAFTPLSSGTPLQHFSLQMTSMPPQHPSLQINLNLQPQIATPVDSSYCFSASPALQMPVNAALQNLNNTHFTNPMAQNQCFSMQPMISEPPFIQPEPVHVFNTPGISNMNNIIKQLLSNQSTPVVNNKFGF